MKKRGVKYLEPNGKSGKYGHKKPPPHKFIYGNNNDRNSWVFIFNIRYKTCF